MRRSALESIDNQGWSRAWGDWGLGIGIWIGVITLGRQSGEYSPPALCLALTAISSAISLETTGWGGEVGIGLECVGGGGCFGLTAAMHVAHLVAFQPLGGGCELRSQVLY